MSVLSRLNRKPGDRVGAILSGNDREVHFLGYGTYAGDELPPGWEQSARELSNAFRDSVAREARLTVEDWLDYYTRNNDWLREKNAPNVRSDEELRAAAHASYEQVQARIAWSDEEIVAHLATTPMIRNPCLELDNGDTVWGMECWWGPEEEIRARLAAWERAGARIIDARIDRDA